MIEIDGVRPITDPLKRGEDEERFLFLTEDNESCEYNYDDGKPVGISTKKV